MDNFSPFADYNMNNQNNDMNDIYKDLMFNPVMQYEQAYQYYKYLSMQMDYKIKCKEFEILCSKNNNYQSNERSQRRVE